MSNAPTLTRENYKAIKHMDKAAMTAYLYRVYMRGVERGREMEREAKAKGAPATATEG